MNNLLERSGSEDNHMLWSESVPVHKPLPWLPSGEPGRLKQDSKEINRLLAAAVASRDFCRRLLANPAIAIAQGFGGEGFKLSTEELHYVYAIRAVSLRDFARQLLAHNPSDTQEPLQLQPVTAHAHPTQNPRTPLQHAHNVV
jgi:hypothetical protein